MNLVRRLEGMVGRFLGSASYRSSALAPQPDASPAPAVAPEAREPAPAAIQPAPQGRTKRQVQALADLVAIAKEMGTAWPQVTEAVETMAWLPRQGQGSGRRLQDVSRALLDCAVAAADASLRDPAERKRMRPVLRDLREALEMYALHRLETSAFQRAGATQEANARAYFLQRMQEKAFPTLAIDWSTPETIRAGVRRAVAIGAPTSDLRASYVPSTPRGRWYEELPLLDQLDREDRLGAPRVFSVRVDVFGLLVARACANYDPSLRQATAEKLRPWLMEHLPRLEAAAPQAFSEWMIDVQPGRLKSRQSIEVSEVELVRMPYAAFEDALATRTMPKTKEEAATVARSKLIAFVDAAYARNRDSIDAARDEYAAESSVWLKAERQLARALDGVQAATSPVPVFAP